MGVKEKIGRPLKFPSKKGTIHVTGKWVSRLWVFKEATKYGLSQSEIFDELVLTIRNRKHKYDPQRIVDDNSWEEEGEDVADYDKRMAARMEVVARAEKKIKELTAKKGHRWG